MPVLVGGSVIIILYCLAYTKYLKPEGKDDE